MSSLHSKNGVTTALVTCLNKGLYNWDDYADCYLNNWLFNIINWQWTFIYTRFFSDAFIRTLFR